MNFLYILCLVVLVSFEQATVLIDSHKDVMNIRSYRSYVLRWNWGDAHLVLRSSAPHPIGT